MKQTDDNSFEIDWSEEIGTEMIVSRYHNQNGRRGIFKVRYQDIDGIFTGVDYSRARVIDMIYYWEPSRVIWE